MRTTNFIHSAVIATSLWVAAVSVNAAEELKIGGGGAAMSGIFLPVKPAFEKATGITLINLQSSPKDGLVDLSKGKVDAAVAAVPVDSMIAGAAKDGVTIDKATLQVAEVGKNRTVMFVHPSNKVAKLSKEQAKGIFTGTIGNWKEVGGDDREIIVVWGKGTPGQNAQFSKEILDGAPVAKDALESGNYAKIKETVSSTPEAIGIDPFGMADNSVKVVDSEPPLSGPIIVVTIGKPTAKVQRLIDYVKGEGKAFTKH
ncbi:MAG TPA: substrate-binding domain-containing protein [Accumulibacter sp.]|jgi:phosphate transport system substrate-binding protein|nr:substrate-binding domain-containing protein [Accumulibacter sp.]